MATPQTGKAKDEWVLHLETKSGRNIPVPLTHVPSVFKIGKGPQCEVKIINAEGVRDVHAVLIIDDMPYARVFPLYSDGGASDLKQDYLPGEAGGAVRPCFRFSKFTAYVTRNDVFVPVNMVATPACSVKCHPPRHDCGDFSEPPGSQLVATTDGEGAPPSQALSEPVEDREESEQAPAPAPALTLTLTYKGRGLMGGVRNRDAKREEETDSGASQTIPPTPAPESEQSAKEEDDEEEEPRSRSSSKSEGKASKAASGSDEEEKEKEIGVEDRCAEHEESAVPKSKAKKKGVGLREIEETMREGNQWARRRSSRSRHAKPSRRSQKDYTQ